MIPGVVRSFRGDEHQPKVLSRHLMESSSFASRLALRPLRPSDVIAVKTLCATSFPINYPLCWFEEVVSGSLISLGLFNGQELAAMLVAETKYLGHCNAEDRAILPDTNAYVVYILSLAVNREYRRNGLASRLLQHLLDSVVENPPFPQAIFLHVLSTNIAAINFYKLNGFVHHDTLLNYYRLDDSYGDGETYVRYTNGSHPPFSLHAVCRVFAALSAYGCLAICKGMITISDNDWVDLKTIKKSDIVSSKKYRWNEGQFRYSPNGRYAAFKLDDYKERIHFYYWINDNEIMTYTNYKGELRQMRYEVDHLRRKLHNIAENVTHVDFVFTANTENGTVHFLFRNQEYQMIPSGTRNVCLMPYVIYQDKNNNQPTMITVTFWRIIVHTEEYNAYLANTFGYKDRLFCFLKCAVLKRQMMDKFLCFDLTQKEVIDGNINFEEQDSVIFKPKLLGPGSFWTDKCTTLWQEGPIVVITEHQPENRERATDDPGDRFWILNLEKETIRETLVQRKRLSRVTLYQEDSLLLWSYPKDKKEAPTNIKYKLILRTDIVPRLKSICSAKLLSQKGIEKNEVAERFIYQ